MEPNRHLALLLPALLALFAYGVVRLFELRFEAGDIYPAYSSLRADPLGTKAFFDGLENLPGLSVRRNDDAWSKLRNQRPATVLLLGLSIPQLTRMDLRSTRDLETIAGSGGRVVIAMFPARSPLAVADLPDRGPARKTEAEKKPGSPPSPPNQRKRTAGNEDEEFPPATTSLAQRWGFTLEYRGLQAPPDRRPGSAPVKPAGGSPFTTAPSWHSGLVFDNIGPAWHALLTRENRPVLMERRFGAGTIVLCSDTWLFSNEAVREERRPELLAWMIGPNPAVIFDETHLGIAAQPGVMTLARSYHLLGLFAGVALLAGLFVWKNSVHFVPPRGDTAPSGDNNLAAGKDAAAGLLNLLHRNLRPQELPAICLALWEKSFARHQPGWTQTAAQARALLAEETARPAREQNPAALYLELDRLLTQHDPPHEPHA